MSEEKGGFCNVNSTVERSLFKNATDKAYKGPSTPAQRFSQKKSHDSISQLTLHIFTVRDFISSFKHRSLSCYYKFLLGVLNSKI